MGKLKALEAWRKDTFEEPRPTLRACQNWAKQGYIPGARKMGHLWFVDESIEKQAQGNTLFGKVMAS